VFELKDGEMWILELPSRMLTEMGGTPGYLKISNMRVVFVPGGMSVSKRAAEIPLRAISNVYLTTNLLIIPCSFRINTDSGMSYKFTTWRRNEAVAAINRQRQRLA
jgi:propanediol utilization protein